METGTNRKKLYVIPSTYFGNIYYYSLLLNRECIIDINETYVKQTYRNRCEIMTANGPASLTVNVKKVPYGQAVLSKDIRIDYSKRWQHQHWMTLVSAYGRTPFFEHYADDISQLFNRKYEFLADLNRDALATVLNILGVQKTIRYSEDSSGKQTITESPCTHNLGNNFKPRNQVKEYFLQKPYWQPFADRYGFVPDLSVLDLIFCEGPEGLLTIKESCIQ